MRIALIYPHLPPTLDGIGDHTAGMSSALADRGHEITVIAQRDEERAPAIDRRVRIQFAWSDLARLRSRSATRSLKVIDSDAIVLQFEQFAWGRFGFNPSLALLFWRVRLSRRHKRPTLVLYAHENYVDPTSLKRLLVFGYQYLQFISLVRSADLIVLSCEQWNKKFDLFGKTTRVIPVFSNINEGGSSKGGGTGGVRAPGNGLQIRCIWFGNIDADRREYFQAAVRAIAGNDHAALVYVGVDRVVADALGRSTLGDRLSTHGALPAEDVSVLLSSSHIGLAPFPDGVTVRRGSFMAAMGHGLRVVTTVDRPTDQSIRRLVVAGLVHASGTRPDDFELAVRAALNMDMSQQARVLIESAYKSEYSSQKAAEQLEDAILSAASSPR